MIGPPQAAHRFFLVITILLAFNLTFTGIDRESLWRDEVDSIRFAGEIWREFRTSNSLSSAAKNLVHYLFQPGWNGPLYFFALEPWLQIAGRTDLALRFPSSMACVLTVALIYSLAARLFNPQVGKLTAILTMAAPYLSWYGGEGKMYTIVTALAVFSFYLLVRASSSNQVTFWGGYVVATSLLFYLHILTPLILLVHAIMVLLLIPRALRSARAWISAGALILPYFPLFIWQWPYLIQSADTGFAFVPLPDMFQRLAEVFSRGLVGWPSTIPLTLLIGAMGYGVILSLTKRKEKVRTMLFLFLWAAVPVLELYFISFRRPLYTERYLIWILPAWYLLASAGIIGLANKGSWKRLLAILWTAGLVLAGLIGIGHQWGTPIRPDLRAATHLVSEQVQPGELVLFQIPYLQHSFDHYAPGLDYQVAVGPYTNNGASETEVEAYLRQVTDGREQVWLILSEVPMWDGRGLMMDWFNAHGVAEAFHFNRVDALFWKRHSG